MGNAHNVVAGRTIFLLTPEALYPYSSFAQMGIQRGYGRALKKETVIQLLIWKKSLTYGKRRSPRTPPERDSPAGKGQGSFGILPKLPCFS
jgi:hypothetical protein